jgi:predicted RNA-binding protein with PUA-like domain
LFAMSSGTIQHWLFKEDPVHYSFGRLVREGGTVWDGLTNSLALKDLRRVRKGDLVLFYHGGEERCVVGIMRVVSDPHPDPGLGDERFVVVDVEPERPLERPVSLNEIKADGRLAGFDLVRLPRLSIMPVRKDAWDRILELARSRRI